MTGKKISQFKKNQKDKLMEGTGAKYPFGWEQLGVVT